VIPVGIEIIRGMAAKREATAFGTDPVEEFIEEHEPETERKTNLD
jgi:membrane-associated protein